MITLTNQRLKASALALTISALILPGAALAQTLEQAVASTLDTNPDIRVAFNRFKQREEQVNQAFSGYLPSTSITAGYGYERTDSPSTRRRGVNDMELGRGEFGVSIRQMLFDGFYTSSEVARTRHEATAEQWTLFATAEDTALDVARVYVGYIRAEQVLTLAEKNLKTHQDIYEQIKQRTDSGLGSTADLSQISGRLARANANVMSARNNFMDAKSQFYRITHQQPDSLIIPVPDADMLPKDLTEGLAMAQQNHPVLKSAGSDILAAVSERETAQSTYYPTFTLELSANWNNDLNGEDGYSAIASQDVGGYYNDVQAMVRMRYNIANGGRDLAREKESAYKLGEAKEIRERAYREVVEGVDLAWNAYQYLAPQKQFIRDHVVAAKETQVAYSQQFNLGQRTLLDLLDTENELFEARRDYLTAEFDEIIAKYRVLNATGKLLDSLRVTRPAVWQGQGNNEEGVQ
ncbi:TolC family outer membrane protein [Shewanella avicenniae]|uniref:TolC family outer membrane protein n=1 Tax=Shewanella avicenniae TaxID=2814294 RepID=A0ABX7QSP7_9GAMM|nr:TolC family outer membrane protein [Shewanella avicenniae]QSX34057.1 TolC family outer membrane protein [Shewanella avicenniae]